MMSVNPVRGEVAAAIGPLTLTLVADMDGLARLSAASGHPTLPELYTRLSGTEPMTVLLALELFTVAGRLDGKELKKDAAVRAAKAHLSLDDMLGLQAPLAALLAGLLRKSEGPPKGNRPRAPSR